jgi:TM2 domain-containing membrane protein YozV
MRGFWSKLVIILVVILAVQALMGTFAMAAEAQQAQKVDPMLAAVASLILPGLGQYLLGDQAKGVNHLLIYAGIYVIGIVLTPITAGLGSIIWALAPLWALYSAYDAYTMAQVK